MATSTIIVLVPTPVTGELILASTDNRVTSMARVEWNKLSRHKIGADMTQCFICKLDLLIGKEVGK